MGQSSQDEADIRAVMESLREAWNRHDIKAYAKHYAEDADVVNVVGWWWSGRPQIEAKVSAAHVFMFRDSTINHDEIQVRFLTPDVAVAHVRWTMVGHHIPGDSRGETRRGVETQVLQKHAGKWLAAAFHNTDSIPEVSFPTTPPT